MALITANGVALPTPSDLQMGIQDISNAQRNANGLMIIQRIATKKTITLTYAYLNATDMSTILNAVSGTYFNVTYLDPISNSTVTGSFYPGDRSLGYIDYQNGVPRYNNLKFELIER